MKIGKYYIVPKSGRVPWEDNPEQRAERMLGKLDDISSLMEDSEWEVTGGISVSLNLGRFHRTHEDIDIGVNETYLPELLQRAKERSYGFFKRYRIFSHNHKGVEAYKMIQPEDVAKRYPRLALFKIQDGKLVLDYPHIDVFPYHKTEEGISVWNNKYSKTPIEDTPIEVKFKGRSFPVTSPRHISQLLMSKNESEKRNSDLQILSDLNNHNNL